MYSQKKKKETFPMEKTINSCELLTIFIVLNKQIKTTRY